MIGSTFLESPVRDRTIPRFYCDVFVAIRISKQFPETLCQLLFPLCLPSNLPSLGFGIDLLFISTSLIYTARVSTFGILLCDDDKGGEKNAKRVEKKRFFQHYTVPDSPSFHN